MRTRPNLISVLKSFQEHVNAVLGTQEAPSDDPRVDRSQEISEVTSVVDGVERVENVSGPRCCDQVDYRQSLFAGAVNSFAFAVSASQPAIAELFARRCDGGLQRERGLLAYMLLSLYAALQNRWLDEKHPGVRGQKEWKQEENYLRALSNLPPKRYEYVLEHDLYHKTSPRFINHLSDKLDDAKFFEQFHKAVDPYYKGVVDALKVEVDGYIRHAEVADDNDESCSKAYERLCAARQMRGTLNCSWLKPIDKLQQFNRQLADFHENHTAHRHMGGCIGVLAEAARFVARCVRLLGRLNPFAFVSNAGRAATPWSGKSHALCFAEKAREAIGPETPAPTAPEAAAAG